MKKLIALLTIPFFLLLTACGGSSEPTLEEIRVDAQEAAETSAEAARDAAEDAMDAAEDAVDAAEDAADAVADEFND